MDKKADTSRRICYDPTAGTFLDPGTFKLLNGVCYVYNGCAPDGVVENRNAFFLPRINAAWDIDGQGNNVVRGGYGMFYNRNMGNVEYDNTLRLAPNAYNVGAGYTDARTSGPPVPVLRQRASDYDAAANRKPGHQHADARLGQLADHAQLQRRRTRGASRGSRSPRWPTSGPAAATWSAAATATSCHMV